MSSIAMPLQACDSGTRDTTGGSRNVKRISRRRFLKTLGISGAGMVGLSGYSFAIEPMWRLEVTRYRVAPPAWPRHLKLSVAVIADVHAGGPAMPIGRIESEGEAIFEGQLGQQKGFFSICLETPVAAKPDEAKGPNGRRRT